MQDYQRLQPIFCRKHSSKMPCQKCIDELVDLGIEQDKIKLRRARDIEQAARHALDVYFKDNSEGLLEAMRRLDLALEGA